jgi:hypothetical protein
LVTQSDGSKVDNYKTTMIATLPKSEEKKSRRWIRVSNGGILFCLASLLTAYSASLES